LKNNLQPITKGEDFQDNLQHHVRLIGELMQDVSAVNQGVAPTFQVGVHIFPRTRLISNVIRPGGEIAWTRHE
jgi:hypothetical protein